MSLFSPAVGCRCVYATEGLMISAGEIALAGWLVPDDVLGVLLVQPLAARRQRHVAEPEREHAGQIAGDAEGGTDVVLGDDNIAHERDPDAERLSGQPHVLDRGPDTDH